MAITTEITTRQPASDLPPGYTVPTPSYEFVGTPIEEKFVTTIATAGVANATPATGLTALLTAVKDWADNTWIPDTLKLDATATVNGIIYLDKVKISNTRSSIYGTGTENYTVHGTLKYE